jgi:hypothetical protein
MATKSIGDWLSGRGASEDVLRQANRLLALQRLYANCVPEPLARTSEVVSLRDGELLVRADNGAAAAKLKQMTPTILDKLRKKNQDVTKLLVAVRPAGQQVADAGAHEKRARLPAASVHHFEALSSELQDSPLKSALERLAARQKTYLK